MPYYDVVGLANPADNSKVQSQVGHSSPESSRVYGAVPKPPLLELYGEAKNKINAPHISPGLATHKEMQGGKRERFVPTLPPLDGGALPTLYQGVLYRSRTEARWACFFNHIGIEFQYEPQGFRIDSATCYLPDFFIPRTRTWAEVKPIEFSPEERRKLEGVADRTGRPALFLVGHPGFKAYEIVYPRDEEYRRAVFEALTNRFTEGGRW